MLLVGAEGWQSNHCSEEALIGLGESGANVVHDLALE